MFVWNLEWSEVIRMDWTVYFLWGHKDRPNFPASILGSKIWVEVNKVHGVQTWPWKTSHLITNFLYLLTCQLDAKEGSEILEVMVSQDGKEQKATCWIPSWNHYMSSQPAAVVLKDWDLKWLQESVSPTTPGTTTTPRHYDTEYARYGVRRNTCSLELELGVREDSSEEESLKTSPEGWHETVRKRTEGCEGKAYCKVMKPWGNVVHQESVSDSWLLECAATLGTGATQYVFVETTKSRAHETL